MAKDNVETHVESQIHHIQKLMARISTQYQRGALKSHALESAYEDLDEARRELAGILRHESGAAPRLRQEAEDSEAYRRFLESLITDRDRRF